MHARVMHMNQNTHGAPAEINMSPKIAAIGARA